MLIIGGMGSIKGAFVALLVGIIDTIGRAYLKQVMGLFLPHWSPPTPSHRPLAIDADLCADGRVILFFKPEGLIPPPGTRRAVSVAATTRFIRCLGLCRTVRTLACPRSCLALRGAGIRSGCSVGYSMSRSGSISSRA